MTNDVPTRFGGPQESPGFLLWQVSMSWQRAQRDALATLDLTHPQFVLLACAAWLAGATGEPPSQAALAAQANVDVMMTSQVVRTLEAKGLVRRAPDPADARALRVTLTAAGKGALAKAMPLVEDVDADFFAPLGKRGAKQIVETFTLLSKR